MGSKYEYDHRSEHVTPRSSYSESAGALLVNWKDTEVVLMFARVRLSVESPWLPRCKILSAERDLPVRDNLKEMYENCENDKVEGEEPAGHIISSHDYILDSHRMRTVAELKRDIFGQDMYLIRLQRWPFSRSKYPGGE